MFFTVVIKNCLFRFHKFAFTFFCLCTLVATHSSLSAHANTETFYNHTGFGAYDLNQSIINNGGNSHTHRACTSPYDTKCFCDVTSLTDSAEDPNSLRYCLSQGERWVRILVAGTIELKSHLRVLSHTSINNSPLTDHFRVTLVGQSLIIKNATDVIITNIGVHNPSGNRDLDAISIQEKSDKIIISNVSVTGATDENIGISNSTNITISDSLIFNPNGSATSEHKNMLITDLSSRISLYRNVFYGATTRSPKVFYDAKLQNSDTTLDFRNNFIWAWGSGRGTEISCGSRSNIVDNIWFSAHGDARQSIVSTCEDINKPSVFLNNNRSLDKVTLSIQGSSRFPFAAPTNTRLSSTSYLCAQLHRVGPNKKTSIEFRILNAIGSDLGCF